MSAVTADARVGAVVVTYQSASTIDACLTRLREAEGVAAIRVVDNDSRDDTLEVVQRHALADPRVRFIANPDNPGFSVACNQGAREVDAPWLAFVNPDCLVEPNTFTRMLALAPVAPPTLLGADLVDEEGRRDPAARRRDPDFARMLQGVLRNPAGKSQLSLTIDDGQSLQPVNAISGALMLLPRALFERIGGFDEGYRLHAEDLDLCRRVRAAGGAVAVANAVRREQLPAGLDVERAAVALFAYVDGLIGRWLLLPDSVDLLKDVEKWVDTGLDMLRLSPSLRK